jgi:cytochrome P450
LVQPTRDSPGAPYSRQLRAGNLDSVTPEAEGLSGGPPKLNLHQEGRSPRPVTEVSGAVPSVSIAPPSTTQGERMFDPLTVDFDSEELARLRREKPVSRTPSGSWFLARFDDVLAATKDPDTFIASFREPGVVVPEEEQLVNEIPRPRHGQIRRIINSAIAAHRVGRIEPFCRDLCQQLLGGILAKAGPSDLVAEYVMPVPNNVIAQLLGAPPEDFLLWAGWSDDVVQGTYPTKNRNERGEGLAGAHPEFVAYVDALIASRRDTPRDDFITRLIGTEVEGRRLSHVEARTQLVFLFISGNETTRHLIANVL